MDTNMQKALEQAIYGYVHKEGGPFGALIIDKDGNVLSCTNNQVLINHDPTAHAEIQAIREAASKLGTHNLSGCTLYTDCEPCPMCLSAIIWANIKKVYYGCTKKDADKIGFRDDMIYEYLNGNNQDMLTLIPLDRDECVRVFREYKREKGEIY